MLPFIRCSSNSQNASWIILIYQRLYYLLLRLTKMLLLLLQTLIMKNFSYLPNHPKTSLLFRAAERPYHLWIGGPLAVFCEPRIILMTLCSAVLGQKSMGISGVAS